MSILICRLHYIGALNFCWMWIECGCFHHCLPERGILWFSASQISFTAGVRRAVWASHRRICFAARYTKNMEIKFYYRPFCFIIYLKVFVWCGNSKQLKKKIREVEWIQRISSLSRWCVRDMKSEVMLSITCFELLANCVLWRLIHSRTVSFDLITLHAFIWRQVIGKRKFSFIHLGLKSNALMEDTFTILLLFRMTT